jgi:hypothetical protein
MLDRLFVSSLLSLYSKKWVWQSLLSILFLQNIYKSYRQVLTSLENSSLLLKLQIFNKTRLATFYKHQTQRNMTRQPSFVSIGETVISMTLNC